MAMRIDFPKRLTGRTYATIRDAYDHSNEGLREHGYMATEHGMTAINMSSIYTKIIQDVGRFAERFASDVLYELENIRSLCENAYPLEQDIDEIFVMGIQKDGVDGNNSLMNKLVQTQRGPLDSYVYAELAYRRILAVRVQVSYEYNKNIYSRPVINCELRDLTASFLRINPADIDNSKKLIAFPFADGNPVPVNPYQK